jgi:hypothetical protein
VAGVASAALAIAAGTTLRSGGLAGPDREAARRIDLRRLEASGPARADRRRREGLERLLAADPQTGPIATILSPTEIRPSVKISALIPARWARSLMIPGLVSCSRWRHGSHSATP